MLERYEKDFDENAFVKSFMERKKITTKQKALSELRKLIKKEGYYQSEIKEALKKKYPDAFVVKISQGAYSEGGIPDVLMIKEASGRRDPLEAAGRNRQKDPGRRRYRNVRPLARGSNHGGGRI